MLQPAINDFDQAHYPISLYFDFFTFL